MKIGIVGLGLIGGSMAKSIKARTSHEVYGIDIDSETMMFARLCGAIDGTLDVERLSQCDLILLAVRPGIAVQWVKENAHNIRAGAVLCDLCGIKRKVTEEIRPIAKANN
ncbi:MAG TPA: prephenate dehydrogenase/arogenate dehydrogenase family protein, partial [Bacillota bacterium]|nr:prephenate dehydrogenase/arogenate dehydrogenase family protein [Bacillota bacterium]